MPDNETLIEESPGSPAGGGKKKLVTIAIVAALMLVEGGAVFWMAKAFSGPPAGAEAGEFDGAQTVAQKFEKEVEIQLPEINAFNKKEGRLYLYHMKVSVRVRREDEGEVTKALEARESTIQDRFNTVIRSADLNYLSEPGLDTIRRQFRFELERILGDDQLILELLIPKFFQSPADN